MEDRNNVALENLKKENSEAERKHQDKENSLFSSKKIISDDLFESRQQLGETAKEHKTVVKDKETTIDQLKADLKEVESRKATSKDNAASDKRRLEQRSKHRNVTWVQHTKISDTHVL